MQRPVIFGEVLFDIFDDGNEVLGGAPFNVAWNLIGFGLDPLFISRVGSDKRGELALKSMRKFGMDTAGVQIDSNKPTGMVKVRMNGSSHTFDILPDQAYDYIDAKIAVTVLANCKTSLLYHGTLAVRSPVSCKTLETLSNSITSPVFVDVNLRAPWSDGVSAKKALEKTGWAKLNDEELGLALGSSAVKDQDIEMMSEYLRSESKLDLLVVTLGNRGALVATPERIIRSNPVSVDKMVDTVGAGDAFSSVVILGLLSGWPVDLILDRATGFSADVCRIRGATNPDTDFYQRHLKKWEAV